MNSMFNSILYYNIPHPRSFSQAIEQLEKSKHLKITNMSVEDTTPTIDYSNNFAKKLYPIRYTFEFDVVDLIIEDRISYHIEAQVDARFFQSKALDIACGLMNIQMSSNSIKNIIRYGYVLWYIYRLILKVYDGDMSGNKFGKYIELLSCNCTLPLN